MSYENLTTFTEIDDDNKLTVTTLRVTFTVYRQSDNGRIFKDYGVNFFGNFDIFFDLDLSELEAGTGTTIDAMTPLISLSPTNDWGGADYCMLKLTQNGGEDNVWKVAWVIKDGGIVKVNSMSGVIGNLDPAYFRLRRTTDDFKLDIYSSSALRDAGGDGDIFTSTANNVTADTYRYLFLVGQPNGTIADYLTGFVEKLYLNGQSPKLKGAGSIVPLMEGLALI